MPKKIHDISQIDSIEYNDRLPSHRRLIEKHVNEFHHVMDRELKKSLGNYDVDRGNPCPPVISNTTKCVMYGFIGCFPTLFKEPPQENKIILFKNLLNLYKWCTNNGSKSTYYNTVLGLAETLAPYLTNLQLLAYWARHDEIMNPKFLELLLPTLSPTISTKNHSFTFHMENLATTFMKDIRSIAIRQLYGDYANVANQPPILNLTKI